MHRESIDVLIIEDDRDIAEMILEVVEALGFSGALAGNGREALAKLADGALPSLILLDLFMPQMNGFEFRKAQVAAPRLANIPVVVVSSSRDIEESCRALDVDRFLRKPFQLEELESVVRRHMHRPARG